MPARKKIPSRHRNGKRPSRAPLAKTWSDVVRQAEGWKLRLDREGRRARRKVEARLGELRERALRDRRVVQRTVDGAVARTMAALNIPSRRELQKLQRRVDELSTRLGRQRR